MDMPASKKEKERRISLACHDYSHIGMVKWPVRFVSKIYMGLWRSISSEIGAKKKER